MVQYRQVSGPSPGTAVREKLVRAMKTPKETGRVAKATNLLAKELVSLRLRAQPAEEREAKEKEPTRKTGQPDKARASSSRASSSGDTAVGAGAGVTNGLVVTAGRIPRDGRSHQKEVKVAKAPET